MPDHIPLVCKRNESYQNVFKINDQRWKENFQITDLEGVEKTKHENYG